MEGSRSGFFPFTQRLLGKLGEHVPSFRGSVDQKLLNTKERPLKHPTRSAHPAPLGSMTLTPAAPSWTRAREGALRTVQERKEGDISNDTSLDCQGLQATGHFGKPSRTKRERLSRSSHTHTHAYTHTHTHSCKAPFCSCWDPNRILSVPRVCTATKRAQDPQLLPTDPQHLPVASTLLRIGLPAPTSGVQASVVPCRGGDRARSVGRRQG